MRIYKTVGQAIERSNDYDDVTYCEGTPQNIEQLKAECDDWFDTGETIEFWTNHDSNTKMRWSVNIIRTAIIEED